MWEMYIPFFDIIIKDSEFSSTIDWQRFFEEMKTKLPRRLLITGRPGAGKTTLLRFLAKEWAEGRTLKKCEILFLIPLGQMKRRGTFAWNSLSDMLKSSFKDIKYIEEVAKEITSRHGAGACFLLDAYDEWHDDDFVYDLTFQHDLKDSFCTLSSRYNIMTTGKEDSKHIEIIGFEDSNLNHFLRVLADNNNVTKSVHDLWIKYPSVREMCRVPLHLSMVIYIMRHDNTLLIKTRAQIYTAFMNVTIKHYKKTHHSNWNTVSLRQCILGTNSDDFCIAFQKLHTIAFDMLFKQIGLFHEHPEIEEKIKNLGFLKIEREHSTGDQARYTFSHPTFLEFFAVLHITTLSPNEQLVYMTMYGRQCKDNLITLFFELVVDLYPERALETGMITKLSATQVNSWQPFPSICQFTYSQELLDSVTKSIRGWKSEDFNILLQTTGIIVNNSLCVHDSSDRYLIEDFLKRTNINKLQFSGENDCTNYIVTLEDSNRRLTSKLLDSIYHCLDNRIDASHCPTFTHVKGLKLSFKNMTSQGLTCLNQLFELISCCLPSLTLLHVEFSDDNIFLLQDKINSLRDIHTELTIMFNNCEVLSLEYVVTHLKLFPRIKGVHLIISDCEDVKDDSIPFERMTYHIYTLPQYQSISIMHNILPSFIHIFDGQSELRHLHLRGLKLLTQSDINHFFEWIREKHFETLEISYTNIQISEFEMLLNQLPSNFLSLNLDGNSIGDHGMTYILRALEQIPKLNHLSLKENQITNVGTSKLAHSMKPNKHLYSLDMSNNPASDFQHFIQLKSLKFLAFNGCSIYYDNDNEHSVLSQIFQSLPELQSIHLCEKSRRDQDCSNYKNHSSTPEYEIPCCNTKTLLVPPFAQNEELSAAHIAQDNDWFIYFSILLGIILIIVASLLTIMCIYFVILSIHVQSNKSTKVHPVSYKTLY